MGFRDRLRVFRIRNAFTVTLRVSDYNSTIITGLANKLVAPHAYPILT